MCSIVGYIGNNKCLPILINGLKKQEYRGCDSLGIAYFENNDINLIKTVGKIENLKNKVNLSTNSYIGIGHTRWATHGIVNETNCHPHTTNNITIVHNGIIENYLELKEFLIKKNYTFYSDTDTEIACAYIDYEYKNSNTKNMVEILNKCLDKFNGSYAIVIMVKDINNKLFLIKKDSPLMILKNDNEYFITSDIKAFSNEATSYISLDDLDIGIISNNNISIYNKYDKKEIVFKNIELNKENNNNLGNYKNYMFKEINEQVDLINKWNSYYLNNLDNLINLEEYEKIHIIGCGTAYHAGLIGKYLIENYGNIEVNVFIASEYRHQKLFVNENTLVIAVSQSGETADTLACIKKVKKLNCKTLGIINVKNSSIANIVDQVIYTNAGDEIAIASTKAYLSQIYIFSLLALKLGIKKNTLDRNYIINEYNKLSEFINKMINLNYDDISNLLYNQNKLFYLGRSIDYFTMLEGALKIKEITYINSVAIPAGELKHGGISLIENNTIVLGLITDINVAKKTISNIKEVKSRGATIILLVSEDILNIIDKDSYDKLIIIDKVANFLNPLINVIPLQLIAYYTALKKGCNIDNPRNLAKAVTVE